MLTTVINLFIYYVLVLFVFDPQKPNQLQVSNIIAWMVAITFAYCTNRKYVLGAESTNKIKAAVVFYFARLSILVVDMLFMMVTVTKMGYNDKVMKLIIHLLITVSNYIVGKIMEVYLWRK